MVGRWLEKVIRNTSKRECTSNTWSDGFTMALQKEIQDFILGLEGKASSEEDNSEGLC